MMQPRSWHRRLGWCAVAAVVVVLIQALVLAVDAGLAALLHFALPALGLWEAWALITVVNSVLLVSLFSKLSFDSQ